MLLTSYRYIFCQTWRTIDSLTLTLSKENFDKIGEFFALCCAPDNFSTVHKVW